MTDLEQPVSDIYAGKGGTTENGFNSTLPSSYQSSGPSDITANDFRGPPTASGFGLGSRYLCAVGGILKIVQLVLGLLLLICVGVFLKAWVDYGSAWVACVSMGSMLFSLQILLGFVFDFFNEQKPWGFLLFIPCFLLTVIHLIDFIVTLTIIGNTSLKVWTIIIAAVRGVAAFSFFISIAYGIDAVIYMRDYIRYRRSR